MRLSIIFFVNVGRTSLFVMLTLASDRFDAWNGLTRTGEGFMKLRCLTVVLLMSSSVSVFAWGKAPDPGADFDKVTTDVEMPHTRAWGLPLLGGAIRTLFVAPRFAMRDVSELAQRLELEYETCALGDSHQLGGALPVNFPLKEDIVKRSLNEKLAGKYDVLVLGNVDLSILPEETLAAMMQKVNQGMGLVVFNYGMPFPATFQTFLDGLTPAMPAEDKSGENTESAAPESKPVSPESSVTSDVAVMRGIGEKLSPEWPTGLGFVKTFRGKQGRVVLVNFPATRVIHHFMVPPLAEPLRARNEHLDTYFSLAARAVRWAAGRDPKCWVVGVEDTAIKGPSDDEIPSGLPEAFIQQMKDSVVQNLYKSYLVHLNAPADKTYRVVVQVRDPNRGRNTVFTFDKHPLPKGATTFPIDLPIGSGSYYLDLWLMDKDKVAEWHTEAIQVKSFPAIKGLTYSKAWLLPNDSLTIAMEVQPRVGNMSMAQPGVGQKNQHVVYARAVDTLGRLVTDAKEIVPKEGGNVQLTLRFADLLTHLVKVEVFATTPLGSPLNEVDLSLGAYEFMYLPVRTPSRANAFEWTVETDAANEYNARGFLRTLARLGISTVALTNYPVGDGEDTISPALKGACFNLAQNNLWAIPEVANYSQRTEQAEPCLTDPAFLKKTEQAIKNKVTAFWPTGTSVYSLGGQDCPGDGSQPHCQSPSCLSGFQSLLARDYSSIAALNQDWGTTFEGWDTVKPPDYKSVLASKHYAGWLDFRLYTDTVFAGALLRGADAVHVSDPKGHALFHAAACANTHLDYDWQVLATDLDAVAAPYARNALTPEWVSAYRERTKEGLHGSESRSYAALTTGALSAKTLQWLPWYAVLRGFEGVWQEDVLRGVAIMPDGRPLGSLTGLAASVAELKSGLDTLLLSAKRPGKSIAIYDSQSSRYLAGVMQGDSGRNEAYDAAAAFRALVADTGRQASFIASAQVVQGKLQDYKVLILPAVRVLSDAEVNAITAFVDNGGCVIADRIPGEFDEHARRRETPPLDALFGVHHIAPADATTPQDPLDPDMGRFLTLNAQVVLPAASGDGDKKGVVTTAWNDAAVDGCIDLADGATAYGKALDRPIWIGKGKALLLNHTLREKSPILANLFDAFLASQTIPRTLLIQELSPGTECFTFQYGDAQILALLADPFEDSESGKTEILGDPKRTYYDMCAGKLLSHAQKISVRLEQGEIFLAASLAYKVKELRLTTLNRVEQGKRLPLRVVVQTSAETPGTHIVHVVLRTNTGESLRHYEQDIVCTKGQGDGYIPLALNDPPGIYQIVVRDVLSGTTTQKMVNITSRIP